MVVSPFFLFENSSPIFVIVLRLLKKVCNGAKNKGAIFEMGEIHYPIYGKIVESFLVVVSIPV